MDIELNNGDGGGGGNNHVDAAVVSIFPSPADQVEPQPFTWLGAAPYIVAALTGVVLTGVGLGAIGWLGGDVLLMVGLLLVFMAMCVAWWFGEAYKLKQCCVPRLDQADD